MNKWQVLFMIFVVLISIGFVGLWFRYNVRLSGVSAARALNSTKKKNNTLPVRAESENRVIYTGNTALDPAQYESDCTARDGHFDRCGKFSGLPGCFYTCDLKK